MKMSKEQVAIINAPIMEKTVVMATAACGKTATLTERIRTVLASGVDPHKLVAITFTNNAAAEMKERLGKDFKEGMYMGTIHGYANFLLTSNGFDTSDVRSEEEFDKLFEMIAIHPEVVRDIDYLLCDESQDLNNEQFEFITTILQPKACLIVGDIRQSIYGFRGAEPKQLLHIMHDEDFTVRELNENYRNAKSIMDFGNKIVDKMKHVDVGNTVAMRDYNGIIRTIIPYDIVKLIRTNTNYSDWAILCRTNAKVNQMMSLLEKNKIPCMTFRQTQGSLEDLKEIMKMNKVKVLTIHASKGLEFDNVILCDLFLKAEEDLRVSYVGVTRARNELYIVANKKGFRK